MKNTIKQKLKNLIHDYFKFNKFDLLIWGVILFFGTTMISLSYAVSSELDVLHSTVLGIGITLIMCFIVHFNNKVFVPVFFKKKLIVLFYIPSLLVLGWLFYVLSGFFYDAFLGEAEEIDDFGAMIQGTVNILCCSSLFFMKDTIVYKNKTEVLAKEKFEAELQLLKTSINPHFLFNTLNSLYALAIKKSDETPYYITKLSDILRYVLFSQNIDFVPLKKEIEFIESYIDIQKLRHKDTSTIKFHYEGKSDEITILPMVLIYFIENAFKHGARSQDDKIDIKCYLIYTEDRIKFSCENNTGSHDDIEHEKSTGIGLRNVKKRLDLIYPEKHFLKIDTKGNKYKVLLDILV